MERNKSDIDIIGGCLAIFSVTLVVLVTIEYWEVVLPTFAVIGITIGYIEWQRHRRRDRRGDQKDQELAPEKKELMVLSAAAEYRNHPVGRVKPSLTSSVTKKAPSLEPWYFVSLRDKDGAHLGLYVANPIGNQVLTVSNPYGETNANRYSREELDGLIGRQVVE